MAKEVKKKQAENRKKPRGAAEEGEAHPVRNFLKAVVSLAFIGFCVYGYLRTRDHVVADIAFPRFPPKVVMKDRPSWMSDALAIPSMIRRLRWSPSYITFCRSLIVYCSGSRMPSPSISQ
jgi:hypothetical protein